MIRDKTVQVLEELETVCVKKKGSATYGRPPTLHDGRPRFTSRGSKTGTMQAASIAKTSKSSSLITGRLILELKEGRLTLHPITNSDRETADLLSAIRDRIVCGDLLWALTEE